MDKLNEQGWDFDSSDMDIEDALHSLPLDDAPAGLYNAVMAQIEEREPVALPTFHLRWIDFALSLFFSGMIGLLMLLPGRLPMGIRLSLSLQLKWIEMLRLDWMLWIAGGLSFAACLLAALIFSQGLMGRESR